MSIGLKLRDKELSNLLKYKSFKFLYHSQTYFDKSFYIEMTQLSKILFCII